MSSPNEPGFPAAGDGPAANEGHAPTSGAHAAPRPIVDPLPPPRPPANPAGPPGTLGERLDRFANAAPPREAETAITPAVVTGTAAATAKVQTVVARTDTARTEAVRTDSYASELPDLSTPRTPPRRPAEREGRGPESSGTRPAPAKARPRGQQGPLRASMQVRRFDPWSVLKVSLVLSVAMFFVWMVAVAFLYLVLGGMGVWSKLNSNVGDLLTNGGGGGGELVSSGTIFGGATLIGLVNIVLMTAMATAAAFIYNLTTDLVGGIEVTLADRD